MDSKRYSLATLRRGRVTVSLPKPPLSELEQAFGYTFQNRERFQQALTHRSANAQHNERLEFLGDAVIELAVSEYLFDYWKGKDEAFVAFASVPFGLDAEGYNIWLYERGGAEMMDELYGRYDMKALPGGNVGQELGLFSNTEATKMEEFKGLRVRTAGWYMDILTRLGASVSPLPGGEIYLALERGVIDAAEFSSPAITYPMGFDQITDFVIEPGVHQPSCQSALFFNEDAWNELPQDLKEIVKICAKETQMWSQAWSENLNAQAINMLEESVEFIKMDKETLIEFRKTTKAYLDEVKEKHEFAGKVLESQEKFAEDFAKWRRLRSGVEPLPYEDYIDGKMWLYE